MNHWKTQLKNLGFTDSESKVYLASLEAGPKPVQEIAKTVGVSRMTAYTVIESLSGKGLMSSVQKGKKTLYTAEPPERLLSFLQGKIQKMESTLKDVGNSIKELKLLQHGDRPVVKLFEGKEALNNIQSDMIESKPDGIYEFGNLDDLLSLYSEERDLSDTHKKFEKAKIPRKLVFASSADLAPVKDASIKREIISPKDFDFHGDILVYKNKVALSSLKGQQISVIIKSEGIAETLRSFFELYWKLKK